MSSDTEINLHPSPLNTHSPVHHRHQRCVTKPSRAVPWSQNDCRGAQTAAVGRWLWLHQAVRLMFASATSNKAFKKHLIRRSESAVHYSTRQLLYALFDGYIYSLWNHGYNASRSSEAVALSLVLWHSGQHKVDRMKRKGQSFYFSNFPSLWALDIHMALYIFKFPVLPEASQLTLSWLALY